MSEPFSITSEQIELLRNMRNLQRAFFSGDRTVVGRAKAAERDVDKLLARYPKAEEPNLLNCTGEEEEHGLE